MSIRCGHCKGTHESPFEVRKCSIIHRQTAEKNTSPIVMKRNTSRNITEGMWKIGEQIYKVQRAIHGSGHLYAKVLVKHGAGDRLEDGWSFERAYGAMKDLREKGEPLTLEEAKAFGKLYGVCCRCGITLTDEESIDAGMGPICAGKEGWA